MSPSCSRAGLRASCRSRWGLLSLLRTAGFWQVTHVVNEEHVDVSFRESKNKQTNTEIPADQGGGLRFEIAWMHKYREQAWSVHGLGITQRPTQCLGRSGTSCTVRMKAGSDQQEFDPGWWSSRPSSSYEIDFHHIKTPGSNMSLCVDRFTNKVKRIHPLFNGMVW